VLVPRDPDRLLPFTDAIVAIAVTLLVLPLVDVVPETASRGAASTEVIGENLPEILGFLLSFAVIIRLWLAHHRTFQHVRAYSTALILCNIGWVLAVIVLPFPTEMVGVYGGDPFTAGFYIGTVLLASACQTGLDVIIRRDPGVASEENPMGPETLTASAAATVLLAVALVLALAVPGLNYWTLLVLFLSPALEKVWLRRRHS
jgi:uncharacterized membrane protein